MPAVVTFENDFSTIVDAAEVITLRRRNGWQEITVAYAWRFSQAAAAPAESGGAIHQGDVVWQFEWDQPEPPRPGDVLVDPGGECFTLLAADRLQGGTRWRCRSRSLRLAYGLDTRLAVEQAAWDDLGNGPKIIGWTEVHSGLHARVQPRSVTFNEATVPPTSTTLFTIYLAAPPVMDHTHRLVAPDGTAYQLLKLQFARRLDRLAEAEVRLMND